MIPGERHMECAYYFDFCRLCRPFRPPLQSSNSPVLQSSNSPLQPLDCTGLPVYYLPSTLVLPRGTGSFKNVFYDQ